MEQIDPDRLDLAEAAAADQLACLQRRARQAPSLPARARLPLRMSLIFREVPIDPDLPYDPRCELCRAAALLEGAIDEVERRRK